jgi:hypothetical protein
MFSRIQRIFSKEVKYKLCSSCGYKNDLEKEKCVICGGKEFKDYEEKNSLSSLILISVFIILFFVVVYNYINLRKVKGNKDDIPVFVSEKRMINYHTYLMSIKNMSYIKPDEHDIDVIKKAMKSPDPVISSSAISTFRLWRKKGFVKE